MANSPLVFERLLNLTRVSRLNSLDLPVSFALATVTDAAPLGVTVQFQDGGLSEPLPYVGAVADYFTGVTTLVVVNPGKWALCLGVVRPTAEDTSAELYEPRPGEEKMPETGVDPIIDPPTILD